MGKRKGESLGLEAWVEVKVVGGCERSGRLKAVEGAYR
jgi:hypothetical protein